MLLPLLLNNLLTGPVGKTSLPEQTWLRQRGSFEVVTGLVLTTLAVSAATVVHRAPTFQPIRQLSVQQPLATVNGLPLSVVVPADQGRPVLLDNPHSLARVQHDAGRQSLALNYTLQLPSSSSAFPEIIIRKAIEQDVGRKALALTEAPPAPAPFVALVQENPVARSVLSHEAGKQSLALSSVVVGPPFTPALLPNPERSQVRQYDTNGKANGLLLDAPVFTVVHRQPTFQPLRTAFVHQPQTVENFVALTAPADSATPVFGSIAEQPYRYPGAQQTQAGGNALPLTFTAVAPFSQSIWPNPTLVRYSVSGDYLPASLSLLSVQVASPFSQSQWPNPLTVRYESLHDDYLNNHWQIDYPPDVTPPVVRDLGGGKRKGIKYIPPYYKEPKKQKPVVAEEEVEVEQEQEPVIKNPVLAIALRDALTKVKADTTKPIPQAVIEALSAPLQFPESPTPTKEEIEAIAQAAEQAVLDEILEDDEEILSLFRLMHL